MAFVTATTAIVWFTDVYQLIILIFLLLSSYIGMGISLRTCVGWETKLEVQVEVSYILHPGLVLRIHFKCVDVFERASDKHYKNTINSYL